MLRMPDKHDGISFSQLFGELLGKGILLIGIYKSVFTASKSFEDSDEEGKYQGNERGTVDFDVHNKNRIFEKLKRKENRFVDSSEFKLHSNNFGVEENEFLKNQNRPHSMENHSIHGE